MTVPRREDVRHWLNLGRAYREEHEMTDATCSERLVSWWRVSEEMLTLRAGAHYASYGIVDWGVSVGLLEYSHAQWHNAYFRFTEHGTAVVQALSELHP